MTTKKMNVLFSYYVSQENQTDRYDELLIDLEDALWEGKKKSFKKIANALENELR